MTNDEFDSLQLPIKINFRTSEAARLILVHQFNFDVAIVICGLNNPKDLTALNTVLELFKSD